MFQKAIVIGCPGAGKSTFARMLSDKTHLPLYYLDMLWHKPDRTTVDRNIFDEKLKEIIADVLNVNADEITMDTTFVDDLGADSLDIFQIIMGIEETYDIEIDNEEAEKIVTVGDAVEQIKNATNN